MLIGRAVRYTETYQLHFYCQSVKLRWSRPSMKHSNMWSIRWNCSESHSMDIVDEWKISTDSIENIQHTVLHIPVKIFFSTNSHQFYFKGNCQPKKTFNKSLFSDVFHKAITVNFQRMSVSIVMLVIGVPVVVWPFRETKNSYES